MKKFKRVFLLVMCMTLLFQPALCVSATELSTKQEDGEGESGEEYVEEDQDTEGEDIPDEPEEEDWQNEDGDEDGELTAFIREAKEELRKMTDQEVVMALVYLCDTYQVREMPGEKESVTVQVPTGTTVQVIGAELDEEWNVWYQVTLSYNDNQYTGYIDRNYLAYSNEHFIAWEDTYFPRVGMFTASGSLYPDVEQFPVSYQDKLMRLKQAHPNWIFVKQNTGLNWQTVVKNENYQDRNLISSSMGDGYKNGNYGPGWCYASEDAVKYYLDPRNFLDETRVFQFEQLTYNPSYHSKVAVDKILSATFMKGELPGAGMSYASAFFEIGVKLKVSPFHLACRVYQEQGKGTSSLISGTYSGYEGYYNYYNIGASGKTTEAIVKSGLEKAKKEGWDTRYKSLSGGALILAKDYILKGQDTLYLQKFDVDASYSGLYWHQYMQNIMAPYSESQMVKKAYAETGSLDNPFVFKIPVYNDMPQTACPVPGSKPAATPTAKPTATPTAKPTTTPTATPTAKPTATPTAKPTAAPTDRPTAAPTDKPTATPTDRPTEKPTDKPSQTPSGKPTGTPTGRPTAKPTDKPTDRPTQTPAGRPEATDKPTGTPQASPKKTATPKPTATGKPTESPDTTTTTVPVVSPEPIETPRPKATATPTAKPTESPEKTTTPTAKPTESPEKTTTPTAKPTESPEKTTAPTAKPTEKPTSKPTAKPTQRPTEKPTTEPSDDRETAPVVVVEAIGTPAPTAAPPEAPKETQPPAQGQPDGKAEVTIVEATPKPQTASEDKSAITFEMTDNSILYTQTLEQIREQGRKVTLEMGNGVTWSMDGSAMGEAPLNDIDFQVTIGKSHIPKRKRDALTEGERYVELSLAHDGDFGFTAVLTLFLEDAQPGQYANLFYYEEESGDFQFMCASLVGSTGEVSFEFVHASDYILIISDETKEDLLDLRAAQMEEADRVMEELRDAATEKPAEEPKKAAGFLVLILLGSVAVVIAIYLIFKKRSD